MRNKEAHALAVLIWNDGVVSVMLHTDSMGLDQALDALVEPSRHDHHLHDRIFSIRRQIAKARGYSCCRCSGWNGVEYQPTYRQWGDKDFCRDCFLDFEEEMR